MSSNENPFHDHNESFDNLRDNTMQKNAGFKIIIPFSILLIAVIIAVILFLNGPEVKRRPPSNAPQMTVEVLKVVPQFYQINLNSFGTVKPKTESNLVSQVTGEVNYVSDNFRDGGFFTKGDVLLTVDDRDYHSDVKIAQASLLDAQQALTEEQARSEQALIDWERLGKSGQPNSLVLRKPQLEAAKAKLYSAEAQLEKAKLNLERTQIIAPYSGRVLSQKVDIGQVISSNMQLATIYATDVVEVRLPIKNQDLSLIDLPEEFRNEQNSPQHKSKVTFNSSLNSEQHWYGSLVRTEGAIDSDSQQLYVVAQIEDPYTKKSPSDLAIKIGEYLKAKISGRLLPNSIVVPNNAIYQGSYIYVVEENILKRKNVELLWKNEQDAVIKSGLTGGEQVVITTLGRVSSGTPVSIAGQNNKFNSKQPKKLSELPKKRQEKIKSMAKEQGISPEEMFKKMSQRRKGGSERPMNKDKSKQSEN